MSITSLGMKSKRRGFILFYVKIAVKYSSVSSSCINYMDGYQNWDSWDELVCSLSTESFIYLRTELEKSTYWFVPQTAVTTRVEVWSQQLHASLTYGCRDPRPWAILFCFSRCISKELDQTWSRIWNQDLYGMPAFKVVPELDEPHSWLHLVSANVQGLSGGGNEAELKNRRAKMCINKWTNELCRM